MVTRADFNPKCPMCSAKSCQANLLGFKKNPLNEVNNGLCLFFLLSGRCEFEFKKTQPNKKQAQNYPNQKLIQCRDLKIETKPVFG